MKTPSQPTIGYRVTCASGKEINFSTQIPCDCNYTFEKGNAWMQSCAKLRCQMLGRRMVAFEFLPAEGGENI